MILASKEIDMTDVHGEHDERFEGVRAALERNLLEGEELGASVAVDLDGTTTPGRKRRERTTSATPKITTTCSKNVGGGPRT